MKKNTTLTALSFNGMKAISVTISGKSTVDVLKRKLKETLINHGVHNKYKIYENSVKVSNIAIGNTFSKAQTSYGNGYEITVHIVVAPEYYSAAEVYLTNTADKSMHSMTMYS